MHGRMEWTGRVYVVDAIDFGPLNTAHIIMDLRAGVDLKLPFSRWLYKQCLKEKEQPNVTCLTCPAGLFLANITQSLPGNPARKTRSQ